MASMSFLLPGTGVSARAKGEAYIRADPKPNPGMTGINHAICFMLIKNIFSHMTLSISSSGCRQPRTTRQDVVD
jgi:hypothetical protein